MPSHGHPPGPALPDSPLTALPSVRNADMPELCLTRNDTWLSRRLAASPEECKKCLRIVLKNFRTKV
jgi:hypothetical protein